MKMFIILVLLGLLGGCNLGKIVEMETSVEAPRVLSVTAPAPGVYENILNFSVAMNESVEVSGNPRITINIGPETRYAEFNASLSTDQNLVFSYEIEEGLLDTNGIVLSGLIDSNGGSIKSTNGKEAELSFNSPDTSLINVGKKNIYLNFVSGEYAVDGDVETDISELDGWSFSRNSTSYAQNVDGSWRAFAPNIARATDKGLLIETARTNKNTNFNANPTDATGLILGGDAAALLNVVDDTASLLASGLSEIATSGRVIQLDNSLGSGQAFVNIAGVTGNTSVHAASVFVRGGTGHLIANDGVSTSVISTISANANYVRVGTSFTPANASVTLRLRADAGQIIYFILNQLEQGVNISSPIVVSGSQVTRPIDSAKFTGLNILQTPFTTYIGADLFAADGMNRFYFELTDGTLNNRLVDIRSSTNRAAAQSFITANTLIYQPNRAGFTGARSIKSSITHNGVGYQWAIDGLLGSVQTAAPSDNPYTNLYIGQTNGELAQINGYIRRFEMHIEAKSGADIQSMTTP